MSADTVTNGDIRAFVRKLEDFGNGLPPNEQRLLAEILVGALASNEDDVEGHGLLHEPLILQSALQVVALHVHAAAWHHLAHHLTLIVSDVHRHAAHVLPIHPAPE